MATALSQIPTTDYRLGFQSQEEETAVERLPVQGDVPPWLTGSLMRVTPAKLESGDKRVGHWFDGLAALNRFGFADGKVSYRSRFLDTKAYRAARAGDGPGTGFGTDPCRSIFKRVQSVFSPDFTDNANVNLVRIGERYIAMTETPLPIEFDAETLATIGPLNFTDGGGGQVTTAHPHHDPGRNELVNYSARFSRKSEYRFWGLPAGSDCAPADRLAARRGAGVHARLRDERALPHPGRVPAAGEPAEAGLLGQGVHQELPLAAGARHALPGGGPRDGQPCAAPTRRTRSSPFTT